MRGDHKLRALAGLLRDLAKQRHLTDRGQAGLGLVEEVKPGAVDVLVEDVEDRLPMGAGGDVPVCLQSVSARGLHRRLVVQHLGQVALRAQEIAPE